MPMDAPLNREPRVHGPFPPHPALRRASDPAVAPLLLPTGFAPFDIAFGGLSCRQLHWLAGVPGSGATAFLHGLLATTTRTAPVLLLDPDARFHPLAAAAAGVHLPHLLWMRHVGQQHAEHTLRLALRADACPLIVWDTRHAPSAALLDRLRPHVRKSRSALMLVTRDAALLGGVVDGMAISVAHEEWSGGGPQQGCHGRSISLEVTDCRRGLTQSLSLAVGFPYPLPLPLPQMRKGGGHRASTADRGSLGARPRAAMRSAG